MSDNGKRACVVGAQRALATGFPAPVVKSQTSTDMSALPDASDLPFGFSFRFYLQTLLVPGVATLGLLVLAQRSYPELAHLEERSDDAPTGPGLSPKFWLFLRLLVPRQLALGMALRALAPGSRGSLGRRRAGSNSFDSACRGEDA
jgi:hypothetical protein